ncbi:unnamed protein product [Sympodiomycopsis kandeliae]
MAEQQDHHAAATSNTPVAEVAEKSSQAASSTTTEEPSTSTTTNVDSDASRAQPSSSATSSTAPQTTTSSNVPQPTIYLSPSESSKPSSSSSSSNAQNSASSLIPPLPSEEIKPTTEELQALYASTMEKNYRMGINPNAPLMTKAMREREQAKRGGGQNLRKTYNEIKIRFRLPDRTIVEYNLPSSRRLLSLYPLFSSVLASSIPFVLFTSPPRAEYKQDDAKLKDKTLADMGWGGAAVVQVKFTGATDGDQKLLKAELLQQAKILEPPKMGIQEGSAGATSSTPSSSAGRTLGGGVPPSENKEKKVPKWFKGFKK